MGAHPPRIVPVVLALAAVMLGACERDTPRTKERPVPSPTPEPPAPSLESMVATLEGAWWAWTIEEPLCGRSHTFRFAPDRKTMRLLNSEPKKDYRGVPATEHSYRIVGVFDGAIRMRLDGEARTTDAGWLVEWDLVVDRSNERYCWHRTDWPAGRCTAPIVTCPASDVPEAPAAH